MSLSRPSGACISSEPFGVQGLTPLAIVGRPSGAGVSAVATDIRGLESIPSAAEGPWLLSVTPPGLGSLQSVPASSEAGRISVVAEAIGP